jgi:hypothetical protein
MWTYAPQPTQRGKRSPSRKLRRKVSRIFTDGTMEQVNAVFDAIAKNRTKG